MTICNTMRLLIVIFVTLFTSTSLFAEPRDRLTVDHLIAREEVGNVTIDEHRNRLFFEIVTSGSDLSVVAPFKTYQPVADSRKRIFSAPLTGEGTAEVLFEGKKDAGYVFAGSNPRSPDGRYLSLYEVRFGEYRPAIFDLHSDKLTIFDFTWPAGRLPGFAWTSNKEFYHISNVTRSLGYGDTAYREREAARARDLAWSNQATAFDIVGSGKFRSTGVPFDTELLKVNVETGDLTQVKRGEFAAAMALNQQNGGVLVLERKLSEVASGRFIDTILFYHEGQDELIKIDTIASERDRVGRISPDGEMTLISQMMTLENGDQAMRYQLYSTITGKLLEELPPGVTSMVWLDENLFYTTNSHNPNAEDETGDRIAKSYPAERLLFSYGDIFYYLKNGDLWQSDPRTGPNNLTSEFEPEVQYKFLYARGMGEVWPPFHSPRIGEFALTFTQNEHVGYLLVDSQKGSIKAFMEPDAEYVTLLAIGKSGAVFLTEDSDVGSRVIHIDAEGSHQMLFQFNEHLAGLELALEPIQLEHTDYEGQRVKAWLYLPPGASFESEEQFPLVTIAYGGTTYPSLPTSRKRSRYTADIWTANPSTNAIMELYAAKGYAVLLPSVPLGPRGEAGEPMTRVVPSILSAVDAAIETGRVDDSRLALAGFSYGGETVLSVAVQSDRFNAILAAAGDYNLIAGYGFFLPSASSPGADEFDTPGNPRTHMYHDDNYAQKRMGSAPWEDVDRYTRNSPFFFVDAITTPILLLHGEFDFQPIEGAEQMFTALHMTGKDVLFVRYFGEGHTIHMPVNQKHMWETIFQFLERTGVTAGPKPIDS